MTVAVFAGIAVSDYQSAVKWYEQLFGFEPSFHPHDVEAVWTMAEDRHIYIVEQPDRAGGAVNMVWVADVPAEITRLDAEGIQPVDLEIHGDVRKYVFRDADGNEIGIGGSWTGD